MSKELTRRWALAAIVALLILAAGACFEFGLRDAAICSFVVATMLFIFAPFLTED